MEQEVHKAITDLETKVGAKFSELMDVMKKSGHISSDFVREDVNGTELMQMAGPLNMKWVMDSIMAESFASTTQARRQAEDQHQQRLRHLEDLHELKLEKARENLEVMKRLSAEHSNVDNLGWNEQWNMDAEEAVGIAGVEGNLPAILRAAADALQNIEKK